MVCSPKLYLAISELLRPTLRCKLAGPRYVPEIRLLIIKAVSKITHPQVCKQFRSIIRDGNFHCQRWGGITIGLTRGRINSVFGCNNQETLMTEQANKSNVLFGDPVCLLAGQDSLFEMITDAGGARMGLLVDLENWNVSLQCNGTQDQIYKNFRNKQCLSGLTEMTDLICTPEMQLTAMGVGKIFSRWGPPGVFPKFFQGGAKVTKFAFYQSKLRKQLFFAEIFKIHEGAKALPCPVFPTPMLTAKYQPSIPNYTILGVDGWPAQRPAASWGEKWRNNGDNRQCCQFSGSGGESGTAAAKKV